MASIGNRGIGGSQSTSQMLSALGVEVNKLSKDISATMAGTQVELQSLLRTLTAAVGNPSGARAGATGNVTQVIGKLTFIAVLQEAIDKANKNPHFNVETAINDLWIHLDAARKYSAAASAPSAPSAPMPPGKMIEMQKLQQTMQKRAEMFKLMTEMSNQRHETMKSVVQNMRG